MWNPEGDGKTGRMMISAVIIVALTLTAVILGFSVLQKKHEEIISAATDTEGNTEITIAIGQARKDEDAGEDTEDGYGEGSEDSEGESENVYLVK